MKASYIFFGMIPALTALFQSVSVSAASLEIQQITFTTLCENFQPAISGDGKRVVFLSDCSIIPGSNTDQNYEVILFDTETKKFHQITDTARESKNNQPSINQDGTRVVFGSSADLIPGQNKDKNSEIFLYDLGTKKLTQLTHTLPPAVNSSPTVSRDGETLVFLSSADLDPGKNRKGNTEVFLLERKTRRFTQVTQSSLSLQPSSAGPSPGFNTGAALSRDGTRVVLSSLANLTEEKNSKAGLKFFLYDLHKKTLSHLTFPNEEMSIDHMHGFPAINDDGSKIVFISTVHSTHAGHGGEQMALILFNVLKGDLSLLVQASDCQLLSPSMNGTGTKIAFSSTCDFSGENKDEGIPNTEIFLYDIETQSITQLTHTQRDFNHSPSIDRSGNRIAFGSDRDILRGGNLDENSEIFLAILP